MEIPGVRAYGATLLQAGARARALALRVLADRMENEAAIPGINSIAFVENSRSKFPSWASSFLIPHSSFLIKQTLLPKNPLSLLPH